MSNRRPAAWLFYLSRGFYRVGVPPYRVILAHRCRARYSIRAGGWRLGNWYLMVGNGLRCPRPELIDE